MSQTLSSLLDARDCCLLLARLEGSPLEWTLFIAAVIVIAGFWIVLHLRAKREEKVAMEPEGPAGLFVELCAAHHLSESQRAFLSNTAAAAGVHPPTMMFVDPSVLRVQAHSGRPDAAGIRDLGLKLFDGEFDA